MLDHLARDDSVKGHERRARGRGRVGVGVGVGVVADVVLADARDATHGEDAFGRPVYEAEPGGRGRVVATEGIAAGAGDANGAADGVDADDVGAGAGEGLTEKAAAASDVEHAEGAGGVGPAGVSPGAEGAGGARGPALRVASAVRGAEGTDDEGNAGGVEAVEGSATREGDAGSARRRRRRGGGGGGGREARRRPLASFFSPETPTRIPPVSR